MTFIYVSTIWVVLIKDRPREVISAPHFPMVGVAKVFEQEPISVVDLLSVLVRTSFW